MRICSILASLVLAAATTCLATDSSINSVQKWAWSANVGWVNCRADVTNGFVVNKDYCEGYLYGASAGWIHMGDGSPTNGFQYTNVGTNDYGVNHDGAGTLSGFAWSPTCGWITFETNGAPRIDLDTGIISGYAWSTTLGWLSFSNVYVHTKTDWITGVYPLYNITVTTPQNGTIGPNGTVQIAYGNSTNFAITPSLYYDLSTVSIDSTNAAAVTNYTFTSVTTNHTLAATFTAQLATNSVPKYWLASFGFTSDFDAVALLDQDGDGIVTWQEFQFGSDPTRKGPNWWYTYSVLSTNSVTTNDYAALNQGQLKWMAKMAYTAMTSQYADVSASISNTVVGFAVTNNFKPVTAGQLKTVAVPFYDWLMARGTNLALVVTNYPWTASTADDTNYVPVNVGQGKQAFNFLLTTP